MKVFCLQLKIDLKFLLSCCRWITFNRPTSKTISSRYILSNKINCNYMHVCANDMNKHCLEVLLLLFIIIAAWSSFISRINLDFDMWKMLYSPWFSFIVRSINKCYVMLYMAWLFMYYVMVVHILKNYIWFISNVRCVCVGITVKCEWNLYHLVTGGLCRCTVNCRSQ